ncbi:hypothetical protein CQA4T8M7_30030 [Sphaerotilus natans]|nr:hypothetical protein CQA4T8M7_30030 [Sphaerotilus natans]
MTLRVASSEFSTKIGVRTENGAAAAEAVEAAGVAGVADAAADAADAAGTAEAEGVDGLAGDAAVVGLQAPSDSASRLAEEERRQSRREIMRRGVG